LFLYCLCGYPFKLSMCNIFRASARNLVVGRSRNRPETHVNRSRPTKNSDFELSSVSVGMIVLSGFCQVSMSILCMALYKNHFMKSSYSFQYRRFFRQYVVDYVLSDFLNMGWWSLY
jgi:hypothetical protein